MEVLKHFSHDKHQLILIQFQQNNISHKPNCYGCKEPILAEPTYNCHKCNIFLHKRCAELPMEMIDPLHPQHPLKLFARPPRDYISCRVCKSHCKNFTYYCEDCELGIHSLCAYQGSKLDQIHPSHDHPLKMVRRVATFQCDACGKDADKRDLSFMCVNCTFWIHKSCALLPSMYQRQDHPHPLSLAYSFPIEYRKYEIPCDVCSKDVFPPRKWVYYCGPCRYFVHLRCITKSERVKRIGWNFFPKCYPFSNMMAEVILPTTNFTRVIKFVQEKLYEKEIQQFSEMEAEAHEHPLILFHMKNDGNSINQETVCNRCTEPIISSGYHCIQCNYSIHLTCSQLPKQLQHPTHGDHILYLTFHPNIWDTKECRFCMLHSNGGFYHCSICDFYLDIKCALSPYRILHKAHEHPLMLKLMDSPGWLGKCNGCGTNFTVCEDGFDCLEGCYFNLCYGCALLPGSVKHRWDKHELLLRFPPFSDQPDEFYCEICEEEIHPRFWQYRCGECDQSFHPNCVAESRNIVFGQTVKISEHQHPITSVPEGDLNSRCNSCHVYLYGKRAFKCASCRYYKCFICMP